MCDNDEQVIAIRRVSCVQGIYVFEIVSWKQTLQVFFVYTPIFMPHAPLNWEGMQTISGPLRLMTGIFLVSCFYDVSSELLIIILVGGIIGCVTPVL